MPGGSIAVYSADSQFLVNNSIYVTSSCATTVTSTAGTHLWYPASGSFTSGQITGNIISGSLTTAYCNPTTATSIVTADPTTYISYPNGTSGTIYFSCNSSNFIINAVAVPPTPEQLLFQEEANRRYQKQAQKSRTAAVHRAKGAIKRALSLIDNVGFGKDVRVFLGGDSIEISHPDSVFKFVLTKKYANLIERTIQPGHSTPYALELYTKTDVHVANLCVVNDSPILDQVLGVCMFIRSGNEEEILSKANWSRLTNDESVVLELAYTSPLIEKKLRLERFN